MSVIVGEQSRFTASADGNTTMGAKQTKGQEAGGASPQHSWKRTPTKERGDILASLMLKSGDRLSRGGTPPPYQRRIGMIQEMMLMAKQGKQDEATEMLKTLRQVVTLCVCVCVESS